jgi:hypothetical protein
MRSWIKRLLNPRRNRQRMELASYIVSAANLLFVYPSDVSNAIDWHGPANLSTILKFDLTKVLGNLGSEIPVLEPIQTASVNAI